MSNKLRNSDKRVINYIITAIVIFFVFFPIYIILDTSFQSEKEANLATFHWYPHEFTLTGYIQAFQKSPSGISIFKGLFNTIWIYTPGIIVGLYTSALAAFAFAKLNFRLKKFIFAVLMSAIMLPNSMSTVIQVLMFDTIGWLNTPWPLMIPRMLGNIATVFFMRQFYVKLPEDFIDAAKIDGLGIWGIFNRIILPMSSGIVFAEFILMFITAYNDYLGPLLYCQSASMYTLQVALAMFAGPYAQNWPLRMAASFVAMAPLILCYVFSQKFIRKSLEISAGVKG